jgi:hypothetical protein
MPDQSQRADQAPKGEHAPKEPESHGMFPPSGTFPHGMFPLGMFPFWMFPPFALTLPLWWCSLFVFPFLDWQRVMLMAYHKALQDPEFAKLPEAEAQRRAGLLLQLYLEGSKARQELGDELLDWQSDWAQGYLKVLEGMLGSFERRTAATTMG